MYLIRSLLVFLFLGSITAQTPVLLKDINLTPREDWSSRPEPKTDQITRPAQEAGRFVVAGGRILFRARNRLAGQELFLATASPGSGTLVKDINPGFADSDPQHFTALGTRVLFEADDGTNGRQPWVTDGTAAGTVKLLNDSGAGMNYPIAMGGNCYFFAYTSGSMNLFRSDGTAAGTRLVKQQVTGPSMPDAQAVLPGRIIFASSDPATGAEAWVTDGTAQGTMLLKDAWPGPLGGGCNTPTRLGNKVYYTSLISFPSASVTLWETDGTPQGTKNLGQMPAGAEGFSHAVSLGNKLLFGSGSSLWAFDGTLQGMIRLGDFTPKQSGYGFESPVVVGGKCYFLADSMLSSTNFCVTDGTQAGTGILMGFTDYYSWTRRGRTGSLGNKVFLNASGGGKGSELWESDGTVAGTRLLYDIEPGSGDSVPSYLTTLGQTVLFSASNSGSGTELWCTDGTAKGTRLHTNLAGAGVPGTAGADPKCLFNVSGITYFIADDGQGQALWRTDGTGAGTIRVTTQVTPAFYSYKTSLGRSLLALGNLLFFPGNLGAAGPDAWVTDGTAAGTRRLHSGGLGFYDPVVFQGECYWWGYPQTPQPPELYRSDGKKTTLVGRPGTMGMVARWQYPVVLGDRILFKGSFSQGDELGISDGTAAGTRLLKDIHPGPGGSHIAETVVLGDKVHFLADDGQGMGLWATDGTSAGTLLVKRGMKIIKDPVVARGRLFFADSTGFWVSDGTAAGTVHITGSDLFERPVARGDKVFFHGRSAATGDCLWVTDGTSAGTGPLFDPEPGWGGNELLGLVATGSRHLFFAMKTEYRGRAGYVTDGTTAGTKVLWLADRFYNSTLYHPCLAGNGRLLAVMNDDSRGREVYAFDPGASGVYYGLGDGPELRVADPVLGKCMKIVVEDRPTAMLRLAILGAPTTRPFMVGNPTPLYLDPNRIYAAYQAPPYGLCFVVPVDPVLVGGQVAIQGLVQPGTAFAGLDFTRGYVGTFGR